MRWYWTKIVLSALAVFVVGFVGLQVFRSGKREVVRVVRSDSDITIPLPFVPFNFDGTKLGTFRKLVLHRTGPERVSGVDVTVRLADPAALDRFKECHLTVDNPTQLNESSSFRCVPFDESMTSFGTIRVQTKDLDGDWVEAAVIPLALPNEVARSIRGHGMSAHASQLEADQFRELGDKLRVLGLELGKARSQAEREKIQARMEEVQEEISELQEAIADAASAHEEVRVETSSGDVKVSVSPDPNPKVEVKVVPAPPKHDKDRRAAKPPA